MTETHSIHIKVDSTDAQKATRNLSDMEKATNGAERALTNLTRAAVGLVALDKIGNVAKGILDTNRAMEALRAQLVAVTGSAVGAQRAFSFIQNFATSTPYEIDGLTKAFIMLQNYGIKPTKQVMEAVTNQASKLGASQETLDGIVRALGQAYAKGKLQAEEMLQLAERGVPVYDLLSQVTGKNAAQLQEMASKGELTRQTIEKLIATMNQAASGANAAAMDTLNGKISNLSDAWHQFEDALLNDKSEGIIKDIVDGITAQINRMTASINMNPVQKLEAQLASLRKTPGYDVPIAEVERQLEIAKKAQAEQEKITAEQNKAEDERVAKAEEARKKLLGSDQAVTKSKKQQAAETKALHEAEAAYTATIEANLRAVQDRNKVQDAQTRTAEKRLQIELEQAKASADIQMQSAKSDQAKIKIQDELAKKYEAIIIRETELRQEQITQDEQLLQSRIAGVEQEIAMADRYNLSQAERIRLQAELQSLQTQQEIFPEERAQVELEAMRELQNAYAEVNKLKAEAADGEAKVREEALRTLEVLSSNLEYSREVARGLAEAFGEVGAAIGGMSVAMAEYDKQSATIEIARKEAVDKAEGDQKRITEINDDATKKQAKAQIKAYGDMTQAAQGFFKKGSKGYEAMGAAVKVFRAFEMAQSAMSMANQLSDITKTIAAFVMGETAKTAASTQSVGQIVFNEQTKQLEFFKSSVAAQGEIPIAGFALMAAMAALMASFGISGGGGGGSTVVPSVPGTGTVKGDPSKQSESISRSLEILTENSSNDLNYSADMLASLRNIESALGAASDIIASKVLPTIANVVNKFTSSSLLSSSSVKEAGFLVNAQSLEKVLNSGALQGYLGARVEKETGLFGEFKSGQTLIAKYGKNVAEAFGKVVQEIYKSIENVSKSLGLTSEDIAKRADGLKISLGKINLAGMTAEEASKAIEAAFSAMSDTMARKLLPEFEAFWRNGEGYFETINRVAEGINRATGNLELLGMEAINYTEITDKQKDVAAEITRQTIMAQGDLSEGTRKYVKELEGSSEEIIDSYKQILSITNLMRGSGFGSENIDRTMINAAGGLSAFEESLQSFRDNFMTDAQRLSADTELLTKEFGKLGFALPKSKDEFYALALGIDKSTEDGKKLFARVITLSQAFSDLSDKTKDATDATAELMASLESGVKNAAQDLLKAFQSELAALETAKQQWIQAYKALNSALQAEVKSLIDNYKAIRTNLLSAKNVLKEAYGQEAASMQAVIDKTKSLSISLRTFIKSLSATSSNISPEQRYLSSRATFEDTVTRALSGDAAAKDELQSIASDFLESSKQYNASSEAYLRDYEAVVSTLNKVADQADEQVSLAEQQLNALKKQVEQYVVLTDATISVKDAVKQVELAQFAETEASKILNDTLVANGLMTEEQLSSLRESGDINASSTQQKLDEMKAASEAVVAAQNALSKFSEQIHAVLVDNGWMTQQEFNDLINGGNGTGAIKDGINNLGLATERVIEAQQTVAKSIDLLANEFGGLKETQKATAEAIVGALNNLGTQISASVGQAFDAYKMAIAELTKQQTAAAPAPAPAPVPAPVPAPEPVSAPVTAPTPVDNTSQRLQAAQSYSDRLNAELKIVNANTNNAIAAYNAGYQNAAVDFYEKAQQHQKAITAIKKEIESSGLNLKWARSGAGFTVTPYANGGMANPGLALVGENGPELVSFGSRGHVSTTSQTQGFFTNLQNAIEKGDAEQTNELQALVRLQSAANQQLIKEMKELKGEMAELARKAKLEAAA